MRRKDEKDGALIDMPPISRSGMFGKSGEAILIESEAEIGWCAGGRWGGGEEMPDGGISLLEFGEERFAPSWKLAAFGGEGGEPHLPIETRLEGGDLRGCAVGRSCFVREKNGLPDFAVGTLLEGDFGSASGHDGEETVTRGEMPRGEGFWPTIGERRRQEMEGGKEGGDRERELEKGGGGSEVAPRNGRVRGGEMSGLKKAGPKVVGQERQSKGEGEQIKEGVIPSEGDEELQKNKTEGGEAAGGSGSENGEGEEEFDEESAEGGEAESEGRKLLAEPSGEIRDGLSLKMVGEGREVGPGGVAAEDFDSA